MHTPKRSKRNKTCFILQSYFVGTKAPEVAQHKEAVGGTPRKTPEIGKFNPTQKVVGRTCWLHQIFFKAGQSIV